MDDDVERKEWKKWEGFLLGGVSMAFGKFASEIRKDRNFMTSHSISRVVPRPSLSWPSHPSCHSQGGGREEGGERESDNDFPSTYFLLRQKSTLWRFVVGAENFIYGTTLLIYELRSDHAEEA